MIGGKETEEALPGVKELLELEGPVPEDLMASQQSAINALIFAETALKQASMLNVNIEEAEKKMAGAQQAYSKQDYQLALTLAKEASLLAEEAILTAPEVEKPAVWYKLVLDKISSLLDKAITRIKALFSKTTQLLRTFSPDWSIFKNYSRYLLTGAITLIIIFTGLFLARVQKIRREQSSLVSLRNPKDFKEKSKGKQGEIKRELSGFKKHPILLKPPKKKIIRHQPSKKKTKFKPKKNREKTKKILSTIIYILITSLLIGGLYFLIKKYTTLLVSFGRHIFSLTASLGKIIGSFLLKVGKETLGFGIWLIPLIVLLLALGITIYLLSRKKHKNIKTRIFKHPKKIFQSIKTSKKPNKKTSRITKRRITLFISALIIIGVCFLIYYLKDSIFSLGSSISPFLLGLGKSSISFISKWKYWLLLLLALLIIEIANYISKKQGKGRKKAKDLA
jgi:hypothetical protein